MTIQEVAYAGRLIKRKNWDHWFMLTDDGGLVREADGLPDKLTRSDLAATDWEVRP